jgi:hypothetical protein
MVQRFSIWDFASKITWMSGEKMKNKESLSPPSIPQIFKEIASDLEQVVALTDAKYISKNGIFTHDSVEILSKKIWALIERYEINEAVKDIELKSSEADRNGKGTYTEEVRRAFLDLAEEISGLNLLIVKIAGGSFYQRTDMFDFSSDNFDPIERVLAGFCRKKEEAFFFSDCADRLRERVNHIKNKLILNKNLEKLKELEIKSIISNADAMMSFFVYTEVMKNKFDNTVSPGLVDLIARGTPTILRLETGKNKTDDSFTVGEFVKYTLSPYAMRKIESPYKQNDKEDLLYPESLDIEE